MNVYTWHHAVTKIPLQWHPRKCYSYKYSHRKGSCQGRKHVYLHYIDTDLLTALCLRLCLKMLHQQSYKVRIQLNKKKEKERKEKKKEKKVRGGEGGKNFQFHISVAAVALKFIKVTETSMTVWSSVEVSTQHNNLFMIHFPSECANFSDQSLTYSLSISAVQKQLVIFLATLEIHLCIIFLYVIYKITIKGLN